MHGVFFKTSGKLTNLFFLYFIAILENKNTFKISLQMYTKLKITFLVLDLTGKLMDSLITVSRQ